MTEEEQRTTKVGTAPDRTHVIDFTLQIIQVNCGPVVYAFFWCMIDLTLRHWDFFVIIRDWELGSPNSSEYLEYLGFFIKQKPW